MKVIDIYFQQKSNFSKYLLLMKVGNFVEVYGDDSVILNNLFNYKINGYGFSKRAGFPVNTLSYVCKKLDFSKVNYVYFDKENILDKKKFRPNNYDYYSVKQDINVRIDNIMEKLRRSMSNYNIDEILNKIESLL